jgi:hypothetical protein
MFQFIIALLEYIGIFVSTEFKSTCAATSGLFSDQQKKQILSNCLHKLLRGFEQYRKCSSRVHRLCIRIFNLLVVYTYNVRSFNLCRYFRGGNDHLETRRGRRNFYFGSDEAANLEFYNYNCTHVWRLHNFGWVRLVRFCLNSCIVLT